jgi:hypothetical protein
VNIKKLQPGALVLHRRDGTGHLGRAYALDLRLRSRADAEPNVAAFLNGARSGDALAEHFGEAVVEKATSGEDAGEDDRDRVVSEEAGGPFVETNGNAEYAYGIDAFSPEGAWREPFPRPHGEKVGQESTRFRAKL